MSGFAILDVETTGFGYKKEDRIIEVGIVTMGLNGDIQNEWQTLINPKRDMGATHVHGIRAQDVMNAPAFEDIIGDIVKQLDGRLTVAHNSLFDVSFLNAEFNRAGYKFPLELKDTFCTMRYSKNVLKMKKANLQICCDTAGIDLTKAHNALGDAQATVKLFSHYLNNGADVTELLELSKLIKWNSYPQPSRLSVIR